ncbi:glycolipid transfer protein [Phellopilus nigrolimitatus]|nr:glycolipid transfer protein [Phellopilus nigrolimitatus]
MAPYLATVRSFEDVSQTDAGVNTLEFLEAARGLVGIFDLLNTMALALVPKDLNGNITKVQYRYEAAPEKSTTLEELVKNEMAEKKKEATQGLLWLIRGLAFTHKALEITQNDATVELSTAFQNAYAGTLSKFHNFIVKNVFKAAMAACPSRSVLYTKLKEDKAGGPAETDEALDALLDSWLKALDKILVRINTFYDTNGYDKGL